MDEASGRYNAVAPGATVLVSGSGLMVDADAPDEGVWLEADGRRVARARVTDCGETILECVLDGAAALECGEYNLVVFSRCGAKGRDAPAKARCRVTLLPAQT